MADPSTIFSSVTLLAWHRLDQGVTLSGSEPTTIADITANGNDLVREGAAGTGGTFVAGGLGGQDCVELDGADDYQTCTTVANTLFGGNNNTGYVAFVFSRRSQGTSGDAFWSCGDSGNANKFCRVVEGNSATQWEARWRNAPSGTGAGGIGGTLDDNPHLCEIIRTATTLDLLIDGVSQIGGPQTVNVDLATLTHYTFGCLRRTSAASWCHMLLGEDVACDGVPTAAELGEFRRYVSERYGFPFGIIDATVASRISKFRLTSADADALTALAPVSPPGVVDSPSPQVVRRRGRLQALTAQPLVLVAWESFLRVAVVGSSTAIGKNLDEPVHGGRVGGLEDAWPIRYGGYLTFNYPGSSLRVVARSSLTTYEALPTGFVPPWDPGIDGRATIDTSFNVTQALLTNPHLLIVNINSDIGRLHDVFGVTDFVTPGTGYIDAEMIPNLQKIVQTALAQGCRVWLTDGQPVDEGWGGAPVTGPEKTARLYAKNRIAAVFGGQVVLIWQDLVDPVDDTLLASVALLDGVHPNAAGHLAIYNRLVGLSLPDFALPVLFSDGPSGGERSGARRAVDVARARGVSRPGALDYLPRLGEFALRPVLDDAPPRVRVPRRAPPQPSVILPAITSAPLLTWTQDQEAWARRRPPRLYRDDSLIAAIASAPLLAALDGGAPGARARRRALLPDAGELLSPWLAPPPAEPERPTVRPTRRVLVPQLDLLAPLVQALGWLAEPEHLIVRPSKRVLVPELDLPALLVQARSWVAEEPVRVRLVQRLRPPAQEDPGTLLPPVPLLPFVEDGPPRPWRRILIGTPHSLDALGILLAPLAAAGDDRRGALLFHPRRARLHAMAADLFAVFTIQQGKRTDYDFDARAWLTGTAVLTSFAVVQDPGDPVVYETPQILAGGKDVKVFASASVDATRGPYRVLVDLADDQGRTARQSFQMRVE